jgi:hypothetical protein
MAKKTLDDLDEIDKAMLRELLSRELIALEAEARGASLEKTENVTRLRALYAFFMRGNTQVFRALKDNIR